MQDMNAEDMSGKLEDMMSTIRQVNEQFKNPVCTSFLFSLDFLSSVMCLDHGIPGILPLVSLKTQAYVHAVENPLIFFCLL